MCVLSQIVERPVRAGVAGRWRRGIPRQQRQVPDDQALRTPVRQRRLHRRQLQILFLSDQQVCYLNTSFVLKRMSERPSDQEASQ